MVFRAARVRLDLRTAFLAAQALLGLRTVFQVVQVQSGLQMVFRGVRAQRGLPLVLQAGQVIARQAVKAATVRSKVQDNRLVMANKAKDSRAAHNKRAVSRDQVSRAHHSKRAVSRVRAKTQAAYSKGNGAVQPVRLQKFCRVFKDRARPQVRARV